MINNNPPAESRKCFYRLLSNKSLSVGSLQFSDIARERFNYESKWLRNLSHFVDLERIVRG
jgi:hypothetical protein